MTEQQATAATRVLAHLRAGGRGSLVDLAAELQLERGTVYAALFTLQGRGQVRVVERPSVRRMGKTRQIFIWAATPLPEPIPVELANSPAHVQRAVLAQPLLARVWAGEAA